MAALLPTMYVIYLDASKEASSSYITTKCATSSCTLIYQPPPLPACAENPSSTRSTADQKRIYVRGGVACRKEVTLSSETYGKSRLIPSSTSYLEMLTRIPTSMSQWISSCLCGISKRRTITVSNAASNGNIFSDCPRSGWHDREEGSIRNY